MVDSMRALLPNSKNNNFDQQKKKRKFNIVKLITAVKISQVFILQPISEFSCKSDFVKR